MLDICNVNPTFLIAQRESMNWTGRGAELKLCALVGVCDQWPTVGKGVVNNYEENIRGVFWAVGIGGGGRVAGQHGGSWKWKLKWKRDEPNGRAGAFSRCE